MHRGDSHNLPPDDELDSSLIEGGFLREDPDSEENALSGIVLPEVEDSESYGEVDRQDGLIVREVSSVLSRYGWKDIDGLSSDELLDLCDDIGVEVEILPATIAIEDIGFSIEKKNFLARAMDRDIGLEEIEDECKGAELDRLQSAETGLAILKLTEIVRDPILMKQHLIDQRIENTKEINRLSSMTAQTFQQYDEKEARLQSLQTQQAGLDKQLDELVEFEDVLMRRERAFRRMGWLLEQDFMAEPIADFKAHYSSSGVWPTFTDLTEAVAGKYSDAFSVAEEEEPDNAVRTVRTPGIIDKLIEEQEQRIALSTGKTDIDRQNEALMLRRLKSAKALCVNVFDNDLEDGIYLESPINASDYRMLEFVSRRFFVHSDMEVIEPFLSFLPGSNLRNIDGGDLDEVPLSRFSGRSLKDLFGEIDRIIDRHPDLDMQTIETAIKSADEGEISEGKNEDKYVRLLADAYKVLEKLVYKDKHSVRPLIVT